MDRVQQLRNAIVEILDTHPEIVAITGRDSENIVAWASKSGVTDEEAAEGLAGLTDAERDAGVIAYHVLSEDDVAADQNAIEVPVQFGAFAADESTAHELIGVVRRVVDAPAFLALDPPLDVYRTRRQRRPMGFDEDEQLSRVDTDITLRAHFPE